VSQARYFVRPFTDDDALTIGSWHYDGPWSINDLSEPTSLVGTSGYYTVAELESGKLVGFLCVGEEARVPGLVEETGIVDVGVGFDPVLVGKGNGQILASPALEWATNNFPGMKLRAVVQEWNERSIRLCRSLGFKVVDRLLIHQEDHEVVYVILIKDPDLAP
jgi:ribosomal-protein-alanine N-acetyltransferase